MDEYDEYEPSEAAYDDDANAAPAPDAVGEPRRSARIREKQTAQDPTVHAGSTRTSGGDVRSRTPDTAVCGKRDADDHMPLAPPPTPVDDLPEMRFDDKTPAYFQVTVEGAEEAVPTLCTH